MINLSMAEPDNLLSPRITVIGVGGGGSNAINNMIRAHLDGCEFVVANTDSQALATSLAERKLQLGVNLSRGLGAGSKPDVGRAAAEESLPDILSVLDGSDMLFVTAGMGGGTGTGAAPVIARAAREAGILTVGVVTKPFHFEGTHRMRQAEKGIAELQQYVDTLIVIPNQNLFRIANERTTFAEAFRMADEVLHSGVRGITDLMVMPGFMNLDFADVKTVMGEMGKAMMGTGEADGDNRAIRAAEAAISNPLLDDISMKGARGVLINITGGLDMTLFEVDQAANRIREEVDPDAQIKVGSTLGDGLEGKIRVSVIATGIDIETATRGRGDAAPVASSSYGVVQAAAPSTARPAAATTAARYTPPEPKTPASVTPIQARQVETATTEKPAQPATVQVSASHFIMPSTMAPKMTGAAPVAISASGEEIRQTETKTTFVQKDALTRILKTQEDEQAQESYEDETLTVASEEIEDTYEKSQTVARTVAPRSTVASSSGPHVREIPPVQQASRQRTATPTTREKGKSKDARMTQLTPQTQAVTPSGLSVNQRAQSLFQRITGFGMIRPSVAREFEEELGDDEAVIQTPRSGAEHTPLSTSESDLLDIPAFLRRQTNH
ncbi:MAG: cell division protein FtsZ [Alphaproteobacteria bacterium]|nr:cell division protein FtsZ [Alphaproteobacteria bacterium]